MISDAKKRELKSMDVNEKFVFGLLAEVHPDELAMDIYNKNMFKLMYMIPNISDVTLKRIYNDALQTNNKKGIEFVEKYTANK